MVATVDKAQIERVSDFVAEYDAQGWHRTGTDVDAASGRWLADCVKAAGLDARLEPYTLERFDFSRASVEVGGRREDGLPIFDSTLAGNFEVEGTLGPLDSAAEIGFALLDSPASVQEYQAARRNGRQRALVVVNVGRSPGLMARNADSFVAPFGPPVLQLSTECREWFEDVAARGERAKLTIESRRVTSESANVVAEAAGRDRAPAPIVVTTPRSGWWQCASERGGGLAAWLEVMRGVRERGTERDVWFVAYSGHELGSLGCHAFLEAHPEMIGRAMAWMHFGANVGGAVEPAVRVSASRHEDVALGLRCLEAAGVSGVMSPPAGTVLGQESQVVHERGARSIALLGGNAFFHLQSDRWPQAVDAASVSRQANAIVELVLELDRA
jgi:hypothetical protein